MYGEAFDSLVILGLIINLINLAHGNLNVTDTSNRTLWDAPDLAAQFGAPIPAQGLWGHLYDVHSDGCDERYFPTPPSEPADGRWIALIVRGRCQFDLKVLHAQRKKYFAVIIYNDDSDNLIPMGPGDHAGEIVIPAAFIGLSDATKFKKYLDPKKYTFWLDLRMTFNYWPLMRDFLIIASAAFAFGLCVGLAVLGVRWIRDIRRARRSRLSTANLKKIPIKKYQKGDQYDMCAICLDEYEDGDKLRVLPCSHSYHQKCIDPWLTKNKKTCPICKRKVIPGSENSDSESEDDDSQSESAPLLGAQGGNSPLRTRGGGTFNSSGVPATVQALQDMDLSDTSSEESFSTSNYQSSVEVHARPGGRAAVTMVAVDDSDSDSDEACGGVVNPALVLVRDHFSADDRVEPAADLADSDCEPLAEDSAQVRVALNTTPDSPHVPEQIV